MNATALITGGTGGLGAAVSDAFQIAGWRVVVPTRSRTRPSAPAARGELELIEADLFDPEGAARAVEVAAGTRHAPLRALVNLVGGYSGDSPVEETSLDDFEAQFTLNMRPTFLAVRAALPELRSAAPSAIVCTASRAAVKPFPGAAGYISSKAAVVAFARVVAAECAADGVRCNTVLPSIVDTPANRAAQPGSERSSWVAPGQIAEVIRFLCSPDSSPMSGAEIPLYGAR